MVRNIGTKCGNMACVYWNPDLDRLLHLLTFRLILEIIENKYRTFNGDRKMYGPMPHSNETYRMYLTLTVLNYETQWENGHVAETNVQTAYPLSKQSYACRGRYQMYKAYSIKFL